ncbi:HtaA domain-containing protein [Corynebacterium sp. ES2794-CONJ1]|uniref:HtaA domain-containing protein n=1 Tax=unclassified Corynebacterium TaxID=2624378 RepID=UPI0021682180|nr:MULTISPECIES: HtaA domain-containing protein [unclassified Corynebacterium]MCS4489531.1 HtaA domain-containing protein [Corynebacterium sp. ES2775-CONJ]MCS4491458.1 HtaA domain-containing protein [Corynebacterium sp. ES2715-CONJ3]MCS4531441.1 HtaA domain-containing protein [Corynebacterium sp. ES2730-CONJ]MCU9518829.1 HtaA domain-containing protein [Corynebacterium sp. ES2794-CONJ1]
MSFSPSQRFLSVTTATMMALSPVVVAPAVTATEAVVKQQDGSQPLVKGTFVWGFRSSLVRYIEGIIAQGKIEVTGPATRLSGDKANEFSFPLDPARSSIDRDGNGELKFDGGVHFFGHQQADRTWSLDVELSNITLLVEGVNVTVLADHITKGDLSSAPGSEIKDGVKQISGQQVRLAQFTLAAPLVDKEAGGYSFINQDTATTLEGFTQAFLSDTYKPGVALDGPDLTVINRENKPVESYGGETLVTSENRTKIIVGSIFGALAFIGALIALLKEIAPRFGIMLPF